MAGNTEISLKHRPRTICII